MEEKLALTKQLFSNYLRDLYIELSKEELAIVKSKFKAITSASWCAILTDSRLVKGLLSYYLISNRCPEYIYKTSVELVDDRFDEESSIRALVEFNGVLILRHSNTFIRNKLMHETIMYIASERLYKGKNVIVISDVVKDKGEHLYYDHEAIMSKMPCSLANVGAVAFKNASSTKVLTPAAPASSATTTQSSHSRRPLANIAREDKLSKEQQMQDRSKSIEENAKNAI